MDIVVDSREAGLRDILGSSAAVRQLPVGDVLIAGAVLVERKTVSDLAASIKDGRWHDQLSRMRQFAESGADYRAAVIVEGLEGLGDDSSVDGFPVRSVRSALNGAFVRDGVAHFCSRDVAGTADLCLRLLSAAGKPRSSQAGVPAMKKRGSLFDSPAEVAKAQLRVIPGVSARIAGELLRDHGTLFEFVSRWRDSPDRLAEFPLGGRRLGSALASRIASSLFPASLVPASSHGLPPQQGESGAGELREDVRQRGGDAEGAPEEGHETEGAVEMSPGRLSEDVDGR